MQGDDDVVDDPNDDDADDDPPKLTLAQQVITTYHNFYHVVLRLAWSWRGHTSKVLPRLPTVVLERAGEMSDVEIGWRVGNMRYAMIKEPTWGVKHPHCRSRTQ